ncbi:HNH endonuclease family protein [Aeromicrobium sp. CTD01-1L150]|uniref:HNH endonuclease family protein n=1 Tax=Aeromicrobium sp. CTD01-1L150 TaxID=3341830 RepID=UPI0035C07250
MERRTCLSVLSAVVVTVLATALLAPPASAGTVSARTLLEELTVRAESSGSSYDRAAFRHWIDADGDGCDTRAEVLKEESSVATEHTGTCTITTGAWHSYYDDTSFTAAGDLDIDHMVPLKEAWISGASSWSAAQRESFANDLGYDFTLVAVSASSNRSKGDRDPDAWLPPSAAAECDYVKQWIAVKWRWSLTLDSAEKVAVEASLDGCSSLSVEAPSKG